MSIRRTIKLVHLAGTAWLVLCIIYITVAALRQAGFNWWVIFSLSGYSALFIFLLLSLYLFAIFRGIDRSQKIEIEHPLTTASCYEVFYDISPFLGGLAGYLGMAGANKVGELLLGITLGTLATTFLVWVVVDPAAGFVETLLSASRKHRLERLALLKAQRQEQEENRKHFLAEILVKDESDRHRWQQVLRPYAEELAHLLSDRKIDGKYAETKAVNIGVSAWQMGGLTCMRELHSMAMDICRKKCQDANVIDYVSSWWDGVGNWRNPSLG